MTQTMKYQKRNERNKETKRQRVEKLIEY